MHSQNHSSASSYHWCCLFKFKLHAYYYCGLELTKCEIKSRCKAWEFQMLTSALHSYLPQWWNSSFKKRHACPSVTWMWEAGGRFVGANRTHSQPRLETFWSWAALSQDPDEKNGRRCIGERSFQPAFPRRPGRLRKSSGCFQFSQAPPTSWQILLRINLVLGWGWMLNHSSPPGGILAGTRLVCWPCGVPGLLPIALLYPEWPF